MVCSRKRCLPGNKEKCLTFIPQHSHLFFRYENKKEKNNNSPIFKVEQTNRTYKNSKKIAHTKIMTRVFFHVQHRPTIISGHIYSTCI